MTWQETLLLVGPLLAITVFIRSEMNTSHGRKRENELDLKPKFELLAQMDKDVSLLKYQVGELLHGLLKSAVLSLHRDDTPQIDELIDRYRAGAMDDEELRGFKATLEQIAHGDAHPQRRAKAEEALTLYRLLYEMAV